MPPPSTTFDTAIDDPLITFGFFENSLLRRFIELEFEFALIALEPECSQRKSGEIQEMHDCVVPEVFFGVLGNSDVTEMAKDTTRPPSANLQKEVRRLTRALLEGLLAA